MQYNVNVFPRSVIIYRHALTLLRLFGIRILFYLFFPLFYFILFFLSSVFVFNIRLLRRDENFRFKIVNIIRYSIYIYIYISGILFTPCFQNFADSSYCCALMSRVDLMKIKVSERFLDCRKIWEILFLENVKFLYINLLINLISSSDFFFFFFYFFINNNNNNSHNET